ncbi:MAG: penicillin-binding protein activator LpoB [Candidatus Malihini olakiniferum]
MKKYLLLILEAILLTGCMTGLPPEQQPTAQIEKVQPRKPEVVTTPVRLVPTPPKIQLLNWKCIVAPLVAQMLQASDTASRRILLVDSVKDNTSGGLLPVAKATTAIYDALSRGRAFILVPHEHVAVAKQRLGLSADDILESRSKTIGLARYMSAQYVLYSDVSGNVKTPQLAMQLILVKTGEIVWSGNSAVQ